MADEFEDKSNNELLFEVKQLEADHEAQKLKILAEYDKLVDIEKRFDKLNQIIGNRLKK